MLTTRATPGLTALAKVSIGLSNEVAPVVDTGVVGATPMVATIPAFPMALSSPQNKWEVAEEWEMEIKEEEGEVSAFGRYFLAD